MVDKLHELKRMIGLSPKIMEQKINEMINNSVPTMSLEDIKKDTLSRGAAEAACVYEAIEDTVIIVDPDNDPDTINSRWISVDKGAKMIISGCGGQSELGVSYYLYGDVWGHIPNSHMMHIANPILERAPDDHPFISVERI